MRCARIPAGTLSSVGARRPPPPTPGSASPPRPHAGWLPEDHYARTPASEGRRAIEGRLLARALRGPLAVPGAALRPRSRAPRRIAIGGYSLPARPPPPAPATPASRPPG